ncbi:hypothetical protein CU110_09565 [Cobetia sp. ICG0124]|nr:hypothetical protein CU110_09565 [Cobetia sp. ICG0124]
MTARSYCVQYRESDFQFVNRLMEQEGLFYYFEHASVDSDFNGHRLVITDATESGGLHHPVERSPSAATDACQPRHLRLQAAGSGETLRSGHA